jgi:HAD superfamily hydrolase (TIGR01509 family)
MPIRAAVFDLDGTLVDNMRFHGDAWLAVARRLGGAPTREDVERRWAGKKHDETIFLVTGRWPTPEEAARVSLEKELLYRQLYGPHLAPMPGLRAFLDRLRDAGVRLALATASPDENRAFVLDGLGLAPLFEVVAGPEGVARGKPAPDIFLAAARSLALPPEECLAFEDAVNGVRAARAAGMEVVGVATGSPAPELRQAGAAHVLTDYGAIPPELEALLFTGRSSGQAA